MAQFRGILRGNRGEASRLGTKAPGLYVEGASWEGKVTVDRRHDARTGRDMVTVCLGKHHGHGTERVLYDGPVSGQ